MIVKIVRCSGKYWWYNDKIGQVFEVEQPRGEDSTLYPIKKTTKYYDHNLAIEDVIDITEERNLQLNKLGI